MDLSAIKKFLYNDYLKYREILQGALESETDFLNTITSYVLSNKGKELRPILSLLVSRLFTEKGELSHRSYSIAAAAEMLHTATLMHDDVADNSNVRRGLKTVSAMYTPQTAVLLGDFWLSRALHLINKLNQNELLFCFTKAIEHLAEGEIIQLEKSEILNSTEKEYYKIIYNKTAALFVACMEASALVYTSREEDVKAISDYAMHLGLAFQIRDDILDYSVGEEIGKPTLLDVREHKLTLPLLRALNSNQDRADHILKLVASLSAESHDEKGDDTIFEIVNFVKENGGIQESKMQLIVEINSAVKQLDRFPQSEAKQKLIEIAEALILK